jgi:branched-chain amino acid transport system permease protein
VLSAFLAGLGGGLFAMAHRFVSLDVLHWTTSGKAVIVVVLGGIGTLWGGVLGAAAVIRLEDMLSFAGFEQIGLVTGAIFVLAVLLFRQGIWGTIAALIARWRGRGR